VNVLICKYSVTKIVIAAVVEINNRLMIIKKQYY